MHFQISGTLATGIARITGNGSILANSVSEYLLKSFAQDLRYAVRLMLKSPGFSLVAILTLALGIGPNSAIFSVVNAVLLRPLPYPDPGRLVAVYCSAPDAPHFGSSPPDFRTLREQNKTFDSLSSF